MTGLADWADDLGRWAEDAQARVAALTEPTLRLGVTGLSRAGKTVFITSLVANLLARRRMAGLAAAREGRILAAVLAPQPDLDAPRFAYERHLDDLYAAEPRWPESTRGIGQLRVSIRLRPSGLRGAFGASVLHLDLVDYPGEWLLDLALLDTPYSAWAAEALTAVEARPEAAAFRAWLGETDPDAALDEPAAERGAAAYAAYLRAAKAAGFSGLAPGRFLAPGDLEGAPALTFAPLPAAEGAGRAAAGSLRRAFETRFEAYKRHVARPFFRDHFARLDRQIVLVDALGAVARGSEAAEDMGRTLTEILGAFRTGARSWLADLLGPSLLGRRIDKVLLGVTKADQVHHQAHPALTRFTRDLLARSADQAAFRGVSVEAMALAAVRATTETEIAEGGRRLPAVRGRLLESGRDAELFAGAPPERLGALFEPGWSPDLFSAPAFAPPRLERRPGEGPPHMRLDRALEFLIGDRLT